MYEDTTHNHTHLASNNGHPKAARVRQPCNDLQSQINPEPQLSNKSTPTVTKAKDTAVIPKKGTDDKKQKVAKKIQKTDTIQPLPSSSHKKQKNGKIVIGDSDVKEKSNDRKRIFNSTVRSSDCKTMNGSSCSMRDKAMNLVKLFNGEFLSEKKLSIVKGAEAFKFKCVNGHVFYRFLTELKSMNLNFSRQQSKSTAECTSSQEMNSSDDDLLLAAEDLQRKHSVEGSWCPKCESFFKQAQNLARNCGFKLCGQLYSKELQLRCLKANHTTTISCSKRLQGNLKCSGCRKHEREAVK